MKYEREIHDEFYFDYIRLLVENRLLHRSGYYLGASNNFVRLFTITARRYWLAQATCEHLTADWKIHFSIRPRDLPRAFNLLAELYYEMKLPIGMKARYPDFWKDYENEWPKHMRGREITIYIFLFETSKTLKRTTLFANDNFKQVKRLMNWELPSKKEIYALHDLTENDQIPLERYWDFAERAEQLLKEHQVESNGCADGDYPIGFYSSLRNEKFVAVEKGKDEFKLIYPPNDCGYNGCGDSFDLTKEFIDLKTYRKRKERRFYLKMFAFFMISFACSTFFFLFNVLL